MSRATVPGMDGRTRWRRLGWALPWLLFQAFPIADLISTPRPVAVRVVAGAALIAFIVAYLAVFSRMFARGGDPARREMLVVAVLAVVLAVWLGPAWAGLMIYVSAAASISLPQRWVWPAVLGAAAVCAGVVTAHGLIGDLFMLPVICVLTGFALQGTRYLVSVNAELVEARDELARNAVAQERLRFARDLHDLLGHSLSLIALKSELAGRLAEIDPARARAEMADVEATARRALAEVRDAVSGYRQVSLPQALAEARSALSAAGITLRAPAPGTPLPGAVDAVLGWVVREATTNVLRHSGARSVTVDLVQRDGDVTLTVTDDGTGAGSVAGAAGAGLAGLAERVEALGGRLGAGPAGTGFRLAASVPLTAPAASESVGSR
jgi:two-component system sensor histidine kinase DesK